MNQALGLPALFPGAVHRGAQGGQALGLLRARLALLIDPVRNSVESLFELQPLLLELGRARAASHGALNDVHVATANTGGIDPIAFARHEREFRVKLHELQRRFDAAHEQDASQQTIGERLVADTRPHERSQGAEHLGAREQRVIERRARNLQAGNT